MKSTILTIALFSILSISCKTSENHHSHHYGTAFLDEHSSKNSMDWEGTYTGTIPCADCSGIVTKINIHKDLTYTKKEKYLGKSNEYITSEGNFSWDDIGSNITIDNTTYMVGENTLIQLNKQKENIKGALATQYVLSKVVTDTLLTDIKWELFELRGQLTEKENQNIPHFTINTSKDVLVGNAGCNNFHGNYNIKTGNRVTFSKIAATQKLCFNAPYEGALLGVLESIDNYTIKNDTLFLNKARMAPLAKFVAVK